MKILKCPLALLCAIFMPVLIWVGAGTALYQCRRRVKLLANGVRASFCSIDSDCGSGYICVNGECVPKQAS